MIVFDSPTGYTFVDNTRSVPGGLSRYWTFVEGVVEEAVPSTDELKSQYDNYVIVSDSGLETAGIPRGAGVLFLANAYAAIVYDRALYVRKKGPNPDPVNGVGGLVVVRESGFNRKDFLFAGRYGLADLFPTRHYSTTFARAFDVIPSGFVPSAQGALSEFPGKCRPLGLEADYLMFEKGQLIGAFGVDKVTLPMVAIKPAFGDYTDRAMYGLGVALAHCEPFVVRDFSNIKSAFPRAGLSKYQLSTTYEAIIRSARNLTGVTPNDNACAYTLPESSGSQLDSLSVSFFAAVPKFSATEAIMVQTNAIMYLEADIIALLNIATPDDVWSLFSKQDAPDCAYCLMAGDINALLDRYQMLRAKYIAASYDELVGLMVRERENLLTKISDMVVDSIRAQVKDKLTPGLEALQKASGVVADDVDVAVEMSASDISFPYENLPAWLKILDDPSATSQQKVTTSLVSFISKAVGDKLTGEWRPIVRKAGGLPLLYHVFTDNDKPHLKDASGSTLVFPGVEIEMKAPTFTKDEAEEFTLDADVKVVLGDELVIFEAGKPISAIWRLTDDAYPYYKIKLTQAQTAIEVIPVKDDAPLAIVDDSFASEIATHIAGSVLDSVNLVVQSTLSETLNGFNSHIERDHAYLVKLSAFGHTKYIPNKWTYKENGSGPLRVQGIVVRPVTIRGEQRVGVTLSGLTRGADAYNGLRSSLSKYRSAMRENIERTCGRFQAATGSLVSYHICSPSESTWSRVKRILLGAATAGIFTLGSIYKYYDCPDTAFDITLASSCPLQIPASCWPITHGDEKVVGECSKMLLHAVSTAADGAAFVEMLPQFRNFMPSAQYHLICALNNADVFVQSEDCKLFGDVSTKDVETLADLISSIPDPNGYLSMLKASLQSIVQKKVTPLYYITENEARNLNAVAADGVDYALLFTEGL